MHKIHCKQLLSSAILACGLLLSPASPAINCVSPGLQDAREIQQDIIDRAKRAAVQIDKAVQGHPGFGYTGSGFFANASGLVVTNYHVVRNAARLRIVHYPTQNIINADAIRVLAVDPIADVALLQVVDLDLAQNGIGYLDLKQCSEQAVGNPEFVVVANSSKSRNFVTKGILGQFEYMDALIPERKKYAQADGSNVYGYPVMTFQSVITAGNSGAPLINLANGRLLGIATGAIGEDKYIGFGVLINRVRSLFDDHQNQQAYKLAALLDGRLPVPRDDDPYYSSIHKYQTLTSQKQVALSGFVRDELSRNPLNNAVVRLFDPRFPDVEFIQSSDKDGHFGFTVPVSPGVPWKIDVRHPGFVAHSQNLGLLISDRDNMEILLKDEKEFVREVTWFYVEPPYVNLDYKSRSVVLKAVKSRWGVPRRPVDIEWSLCEHDDSCDYNKQKRWLKASKTNGKIYRGEDHVKLVFSQQGQGDQDPSLLVGDLMFYPRGDDELNPREAQVFVYAQQDEGDFNHIQGFVTHTDGGVPRENSVTITARKLDAEGNSVSATGYPIFVENDGFFQYRAPRVETPGTQKVQFLVESPFYRALQPENNIVDLGAPPSHPVTIKLETR